MTFSDLVVLVMEVMSRTTHSDMVTMDAEVEMEEEVLQLGVLADSFIQPGTSVGTRQQVSADMSQVELQTNIREKITIKMTPTKVFSWLKVPTSAHLA